MISFNFLETSLRTPKRIAESAALLGHCAPNGMPLGRDDMVERELLGCGRQYDDAQHVNLGLRASRDAAR